MRTFNTFRRSCVFIGVVIASFSLTVLGLYEDNPSVYRPANVDQFDNTVVQSDALWLVQICNPQQDPCQVLSEHYSNLASLMKGVFRTAYIDVTTGEGGEIANKFRMDVSKLPALYWFLDDKTKPEAVPRPVDGMESLTVLVMNKMAETISARAQKLGLEINLQGGTGQDQQKQQKKTGGRKKKSKGPSKVVHVTGEEEFENKVIMDPLVSMVAFTAPWCGHCKMLQPEWEEAAEKLEGHGAQLVWIDATDSANQQLAQAFNVQGYPTMVTFPGGAPKDKGKARPYPGERKAEAIVKYILDEVDRTGIPKEIPELTSSDVLKEECNGHNHICVVAALPHILDSGASGRNQYRELLAKVAKTFRGSAFSFLWFQGGSQPAFETVMELTFGYPAILAYSMDRNAFAVMHGSFTEKGVTSFLHGVTSGRVPVGKLAKQEVPQIEPTEPWDGQDAAPPEEEFDLADIMGWDDEDEGEEKENPKEEL